MKIGGFDSYFLKLFQSRGLFLSDQSFASIKMPVGWQLFKE